MSDKADLIRSMAGVEPYTPHEGESFMEYTNVSTGNCEPPAYMVAFVLFSALNYQNYGGMIEKVWWHTYFTYKGSLFIIRDFKFGTWSLYLGSGLVLSVFLGKGVEVPLDSHRRLRRFAC